MKTVFWFVGLFAAAVALALLMGQNSATVTLFWPPYRVDMSFNLVLAAVLLVFVLAYLSLRSMAALQSLPQRAARWRQLRRERAVHVALFDALAHQMAGRFVRARSAAREAIDQLDAQGQPTDETLPQQAQWQAMGHLLAAEAAHSLRDHAARDRAFALAMAAAGAGSGGGGEGAAVREGALLRAVRWAVEDRDLTAASHWLSQLPQGASRRTLALRLKLRVAQLAHDPTTALDTARLLAKHGAFSAVASRSLLRGLFMDGLRACHDADQVRALWKGTDARDRQDADLALLAVARLRAMAPTDDQPAEVLAHCRDWIAPVWEAYPSLGEAQRQRLVQVMQTLFDGVDLAWLARVETLQRNRPADPLLQYLAADVFFRQRLWGKAQALFSQAVRGVQPVDMRVHAWVRLAELAEQRGDSAAALAAWREAAMSPLGDPNTVHDHKDDWLAQPKVV